MQKLIIIAGGLVASMIGVVVVSSLDHLLDGVFLGRIVAIALTLITTAITFSLTYATTGAVSGKTEGAAAGIFAGVVGGVLIWAISDTLFGPFQMTGALIAGLIGGFMFSAQVDPKLG